MISHSVYVHIAIVATCVGCIVSAKANNNNKLLRHVITETMN